MATFAKTNAMRVLLISLIFVHGLLHIPGFIKAFGIAALPRIPHPISRFHGVLWAVAAVLFISTSVLFLNYNSWWWIVSVVALILSQYLIFSDWEDAGLGTGLNIVILVITIVGYAVWSFSHTYRSEVTHPFRYGMPAPVQQYTANAEQLFETHRHKLQATGRSLDAVNFHTA